MNAVEPPRSGFGFDLNGLKFGLLTVVRLVGRRHTYKLWECRCSCGGVTQVTTGNLRSGQVKSCGCLVVNQCRSLRRLNLKTPGESAFNWLFDVYKCSARDRGYEFDLIPSDVRRLTQMNCHYCGSVPSRLKRVKSGNGHYVYNGLDRIDNKKGYTLENVVPCCKTCNRAKDIMTVAEFAEWVSRVCNHLNLKN